MPDTKAPLDWPTERFLTADPAEVGLDEGLLAGSDAYIEAKLPKLYSFLVVRRGLLLHERYFHGLGPESLMDVRSVTKSFTSALLGLALANRGMESLDRKLYEFVPEAYPESEDPRRNLTLKHLLTMTSGLYWKTGNKLGEKYIQRLHRSPDWLRFILRLPLGEESRERFQYRSPDSHLLSCIITRLTGKSASDYAETDLFGPLGIRHWEWPSDPQGNSAGHVFLQLCSRDLAKLGLLYLYEGTWEGSKLLNRDWVMESVKDQSEGMSAFGAYGFQWWTGKINEFRTFQALGHGGQYIYVLPELEMVVVTTADARVNRWRNPKALLEQFVIPSVKGRKYQEDGE